jgi:hypothetical protein
MSGATSGGRLRDVTAQVVDELTSKAMPFTALDVSNAVKHTLPEARHREIAPLVRDQFERKGMGAYTQTMIDVMAGGTTPARAYLYHLPEQPASAYDDAMRAQLAIPPDRSQRGDGDHELVASATEARVRIGKDGRGRVSRRLLHTAGIDADRVVVRSDPAVPRLQIVAIGATATRAVDPLYALPDLLFAPTELGQPIQLEHPSLLHLPRSLLAMFGDSPALVARIEGASVVVVRA